MRGRKDWNHLSKAPLTEFLVVPRPVRTAVTRAALVTEPATGSRSRTACSDGSRWRCRRCGQACLTLATKNVAVVRTTIGNLTPNS